MSKKYKAIPQTSIWTCLSTINFTPLSIRRTRKLAPTPRGNTPDRHLERNPKIAIIEQGTVSNFRTENCLLSPNSIMRNLEIASVFNQIADLLEIQGANPFRIRAYRRAALNIEGLADNVETLSLGGSLDKIPGIGSDLAGKIDEYLRTGRMEFHEQLKKEVPLALAKMVEIPSVGPKTAKEIYDRFRIETIEDLEALCKTDKLLCVPGYNEKSVDNILRGIELYRRRRGNYLLGRAVPLARALCEYLESAAERIAYAGSLRRMKEIVHDIDILAASKGKLPNLVEPEDIRGDLHMHTTWSDGKYSAEEMLDAARRRGYRYIALTDHSKSLGVAGGLSDEDLMKHTEVCHRLDAKYSDIRVLAGTEVDIRQDGTLDYSDELLAKLDFVVASLHTGFKQDRARLTARVVRAMQNPCVRVIGHPTGRLLGDRDLYDIDLDEVLKEGARTRTCLEVNANFHRLDLNDVHCRKARDMGVHVIISTDSHNYDDMLNLPYGVATAQRGWIEKDSVLNAKPVEEMLNFKKTR